MIVDLRILWVASRCRRLPASRDIGLSVETQPNRRSGRPPRGNHGRPGESGGLGEPGRFSRAHGGGAYGCSVPVLTRFASPHRPGPPRLTRTPDARARGRDRGDCPAPPPPLQEQPRRVAPSGPHLVCGFRGRVRLSILAIADSAPNGAAVGSLGRKPQDLRARRNTQPRRGDTTGRRRPFGAVRCWLREFPGLTPWATGCRPVRG